MAMSALGHAASAAAFLFGRQPSRPNAPKPVAKSGSAVGSGCSCGRCGYVENNEISTGLRISLHLYSMKSLNPLCPSSLSLYWHERWSALVLDQDHQEFRRLGTVGVSVNDMNIVGAFIEGPSWCQCYLLSTLQLHHNGVPAHRGGRCCC